MKPRHNANSGESRYSVARHRVNNFIQKRTAWTASCVRFDHQSIAFIVAYFSSPLYVNLKLDTHKARIPRRRHRTPREDPRRHLRHARLKLFLWQAERHVDILGTIVERMSARMSVSASWNASFTEQCTKLAHGHDEPCERRRYRSLHGPRHRDESTVGGGWKHCKQADGQAGGRTGDCLITSALITGVVVYLLRLLYVRHAPLTWFFCQLASRLQCLLVYVHRIHSLSPVRPSLSVRLERSSSAILVQLILIAERY